MEMILAILSRHTQYPRNHMTSETLLSADLGLTSFAVVNIVCEFEDAFDIEIPDKVIRKLQTIGDIAEYIDARK